MNSKSKNIDLTRGSICRQLLFFFLPILAGSLFQQLYTTADAVIVGQYAGKVGLAAIDSVYSLLKLPVNFLVGLSTGATILISQLFGGRQEKELSKAVHTALAFALVGGAIFAAAGVVLAPWLLEWVHVPEHIFGQTLSYVRIYYSGLAFSMLYNMGAGVLRAVGNSQLPLKILLICGSVNVVLDLIFVAGLGWGVSGAALATILSQLVSAVLITAALMKTAGSCRIVLSRIRLEMPELKRILCLGLPVGLQSSLYPIANMLIQASINSTGTDNIAAWALCGKLDFMIWLCADSLGAAVSTFCAQNYGARQLERVKKGVKLGLLMTLSIVLVLSGVLFLWCEELGRLFISKEDAEIIPLMGSLMRFLAPLYFLYVFGEVLSGAIRGTGETIKPMLLTLVGTCAVRVLWVLLVVPYHPGIHIRIASYPVSWGLTAVFFVVYYHSLQKKRLASVCR